RSALGERAAAALRRDRLASMTWTESFLGRFLHLVKRDAVFLPDATRVLAGREAEDLRCFGADEAHALTRQRIELIDIHAFALQRGEDLTPQRIRNRSALERASKAFGVSRAEVLERTGADHADRPTGKCYPHIFHLIEEIGRLQSLPHRARRNERQCFDC